MRMTKERALQIQAEQIPFYERQYHGIGEIIRKNTKHDHLLPGIAYSNEELNRSIPRGMFIEKLVLLHPSLAIRNNKHDEAQAPSELNKQSI